MSLFKSRRGMYMASPFLGVLFFTITVSVAGLIISEGAQQMETAHATDPSDLTFSIYAISADATDVYLQNAIQFMIDTHAVTDPKSSPIVKQLETDIPVKLMNSLQQVYRKIYETKYLMSCEPQTHAVSHIYISFNGDAKTYILKDAYPDGNDITTPFGPLNDTAVFPSIVQYGLNCTLQDPPLKVGIPLKGRWYYLDADCICCQSPDSCSGLQTGALYDITHCIGPGKPCLH